MYLLQEALSFLEKQRTQTCAGQFSYTDGPAALGRFSVRIRSRLCWTNAEIIVRLRDDVATDGEVMLRMRKRSSRNLPQSGSRAVTVQSFKGSTDTNTEL